MSAFADRYGPVALVTGASSGIGRCFAGELAARGLDLVLTARRADRLEALAVELADRHGTRARVCPLDLAAPDAAAMLLDATADLDIGLVVSNAGFGLKGAHADLDPARIAAMVAVNCTTPALIAHGFIPRLRARGRGGLLFTSSVEALVGCPFSAAYSGSKAFLNNLVEALWGELHEDGVDVLALCPGATATEAASLQGIDLATLSNVMAPELVATLALDRLADGPVFVSSEHHSATFARLRAMPPRDALAAMAERMRPGPTRTEQERT